MSTAIMDSRLLVECIKKLRNEVYPNTIGILGDLLQRNLPISDLSYDEGLNRITLIINEKELDKKHSVESYYPIISDCINTYFSTKSVTDLMNSDMSNKKSLRETLFGRQMEIVWITAILSNTVIINL